MAFPFLALIPVVGQLLDKIIPDPAKAAEAKFKLAELAQNGEFHEFDANVQLALAQIKVNEEEAKAPGVFKGGWRPAAGWLCVAGGLAYPLVRSILPWALAVVGVDGVPPMPALDTTEALAMLGALLGLGTMRMTERLKERA
jgi:hypothetical protein